MKHKTSLAAPSETEGSICRVRVASFSPTVLLRYPKKEPPQTNIYKVPREGGFKPRTTVKVKRLLSDSLRCLLARKPTALLYATTQRGNRWELSIDKPFLKPGALTAVKMKRVYEKLRGGLPL